MTEAQFRDHDFYFNGGMALVQIDSELEHPDGKYYKVCHEAATDRVFKEEGFSHAIIDLVESPEGIAEARAWFHECFVPMDESRVPKFLH